MYLYMYLCVGDREREKQIRNKKKVDEKKKYSFDYRTKKKKKCLIIYFIEIVFFSFHKLGNNYCYSLSNKNNYIINMFILDFFFYLV